MELDILYAIFVICHDFNEYYLFMNLIYIFILQDEAWRCPKIDRVFL